MHDSSDTHTQKAKSQQRQRLDVVRSRKLGKLSCRLCASRSRKHYQRHNKNVSSSSEVRHEGLTSSESRADFARCARVCTYISECWCEIFLVGENERVVRSLE